MYQQYLQEVADQTKRYGERMQPPATPTDLASLSNRAMAELGINVPQEYKEFLRITDGLNWNGLFVYSSHNTDDYKHGFVESNRLLRDSEVDDEFLYLGDSDINLYVYSLVDQEYQMCDRPSMDVYGRYKTFDEMIAAALKNCIIGPPSDEEKDEEQ